MTGEKKGKREKETVKPVKGKKDELSDKDLEKASGGTWTYNDGGEPTK